MVIQYLPSTEVLFDDILVAFSEDRKSVRKKLNRHYEEANETIELDEEAEPLNLRRDIYFGVNSAEFHFFLNYDSKDLLIEIEVHQCEKLQVMNLKFDFNHELDMVALELSKYSRVTIISEGEILFNDLKIVLSDKRKMGGEGNSIGYFYCASDISHLHFQ
jgi:hypothetical protein